MKENKKKKPTIYIVGVIVLLVVGFFIMKEGSGKSATGNGEGEIQKVVLGVKELNYYPNTVTVKAGKPVRVYLDASVRGCLRSFTMRDFGIAKNLPTPSDYVEFTPKKKGTYAFACSMGMGTGTMIVQ